MDDYTGRSYKQKQKELNMQNISVVQASPNKSFDDQSSLKIQDSLKSLEENKMLGVLKDFDSGSGTGTPGFT